MYNTKCEGNNIAAAEVYELKCAKKAGPFLTLPVVHIKLYIILLIFS